jgi:hypothetical protein
LIPKAFSKRIAISAETRNRRQPADARSVRCDF